MKNNLEVESWLEYFGASGTDKSILRHFVTKYKW